jgi:hypothetical protein
LHKIDCSKETAVVHFEDHESAKIAKENGAKVSTKFPDIGAIFFGKAGPIFFA